MESTKKTTTKNNNQIAAICSFFFVGPIFICGVNIACRFEHDDDDDDGQILMFCGYQQV